MSRAIHNHFKSPLLPGAISSEPGWPFLGRAAEVIRVLLIEDSVTDIEMVQRFLDTESMPRFDIHVAQDLEDGLRQLENARQDAVLLDLFLPGSNGLDTLRRAKAAASDTPIIVLTGIDDEELAAQAAREGAEDYLEKERVDFHQLSRSILYAVQRRLSYAALQASELQYRTLVENVNIGVYRNTGGERGQFLQANPTIAEMFGYDSVEEFMRVAVADLYHDPRDRACFVNEAREKGFVRGKELLLKKRDGTTLWASCTAKVTYDAQGRIRWMDGVIEDITDRKRADEMLRQQAQILENMTEGVSVSDKDGRIVFTNASFDHMFGYGRGELLGQHVSTLNALDNIDNDQITKEILQTSAMGERWQREFKNKRKDGTPFTTLAQVSALEIGGKTCFVSVQENISDRRDAEKRLEQSEARLRAFADALPDLAFIINQEGRYVDILTARKELLYLPPEKLQGQLVHDVLPKALADLYLEVIHTTIATGASQRFEYSLNVQAGKRFFEANTSLFADTPAGENLVVLLARDITERTQAEAELEQTRTFLDSIVENIPDSVFVKDADDLRFVLINKASENLFGFSKAEMIGKTDYDLFPEEEADFFTDTDRNVLAQHGPVDIPQEPLETSAKELRLLHTKKIPIRDSLGHPKYLLGISEDITERDATQKALRVSEERYRVLYENIPVMYFTLDTEGTVVSVNKYGIEHLGYSEKELVGESVLKVFHPDDKDVVAASLKSCLAEPARIANWEFRKVKKDGTVIWVEEAVRVVSSADGQKVVLVACEDITERKKTEQQLVRLTETLGNQTQILQSVLQSMGDGVLVADTSGNLLLSNPMAEQVLGSDFGSESKQNWRTAHGLLVPDTEEPFPPHDLPLARAMRGEACDQVEILVRNRKSPEGVYMSVSGRPLRDEEGKLKGGVAVFHDITTRRRFQEETRRLTATLMDAQEQERHAISTTLHDNLGQMLTLARMELDSVPPESTVAEQVSSAIRRLDDALAAVRDMAVSLRPPLLDDLGLEAAMESLVEEFSESASIKTSFSREGPAVTLDKAKETCLYRVLQEALTNIAKHSKASEVNVLLEASGKSMFLRIRDNGKGFDQANPNKEAGIGLVGMRERLTKLGGKFEVRSSRRVGTTVRAFMPV